MIKLYGLTTVLVLLVLSPDAGSLGGRITDENQRAIDGATVSATNVFSREVEIVQSDTAGFYRLGPMRPGRYTVFAKAEGHGCTWVFNVFLFRGQHTQLDIDAAWVPEERAGWRLYRSSEEHKMNIKEVVFPIDFSDRSIDACPYVAALARRLRANLTLLHVVESLPPGSSPLDRLYTGDAVELAQRKQSARDALSAFQQQYIPHVPSELCVLVGDPATSIVVYGGESKGRMIVMPTRGFGPFRQMLLGSVTAKVLHDARCPVLTGPHLEKAIHPKQWLKLQRIMCAVALDWETDEVLKRSAELADQLGAQLIATHVITPVEEGLLPLMDPSEPPISTESVHNAMQEALDRTGVPAQVDVLVGEPSRRVACAAKEHNVDLVVIGKGGAPELPGRLGSHGYAIVRRAPCPVLCI